MRRERFNDQEENCSLSGYYATVEELIKDREGTAEGLLAVEGENTMVLFMGKKGEEGIDYGVEVFQKRLRTILAENLR